MLKNSCLLLAVVCLAGGCSTIKFPGVYRIPIQQGNYLEQDMIDQLKPGLTKRQVRYIMGSPMIEDTFNPDRWDYHYNLKRGDVEIKTNHLVVHFKDDKLTRWEGDYTPIKSQVEQDQEDALKAAEKKEKSKF